MCIVQPRADGGGGTACLDVHPISLFPCIAANGKLSGELKTISAAMSDKLRLQGRGFDGPVGLA